METLINLVVILLGLTGIYLVGKTFQLSEENKQIDKNLKQLSIDYAVLFKKHEELKKAIISIIELDESDMQKLVGKTNLK